MHVRKVVCGLALVLAAAGTAAARDAGRQPHQTGAATVGVWPRIAFAGAGVRLMVRVPAAADNRRLRITVDSGTYMRTSEIDLGGDRAPEAHWFDLRDLPAGEYVVEAVVFGSTGPRTRVEDHFSRQ